MIDIKNPELLRYVRSELRPARVATIIGGTLFGAILLALIVSINADHRFISRVTYWREVYAAVFIASTVVLVLWTLLNSSQAIVGERTHRTFDFWRTTRLSPLTLATGKLFGAPIGAWLQYATALPILVITGLLGGYRMTTTIGSYLLLALFDVALGSVALCLSMRAQDARAVNHADVHHRAVVPSQRQFWPWRIGSWNGTFQRMERDESRARSGGVA